MTNPTLERAARALALASYRSGAEDCPDIFLEAHRGSTPDQLVEKFWQDWLPETRAALMAVLPELQRVTPEEQGPVGRGWMEDVVSPDGEYVRYDDLTAILAEGE